MKSIFLDSLAACPPRDYVDMEKAIGSDAELAKMILEGYAGLATNAETAALKVLIEPILDRLVANHKSLHEIVYWATHGIPEQDY